MLFTKDDHVVKAFPAKCSNDTFGEWILPWTSWGGWLVFQSKPLYGSLELIAIDAIIITNHILRGFIESKSFTKLLNCPL